MRKFPVVAVLENIRSALNVGAIFRTCDGAGVSKLFLTGITPYPPHNKIPKTALGAIDMVKWKREKDTLTVIKKLKSEGYKIVSVEINENAVKYTDYKFKDKTALIFGNEISGVSDEVLDLSDQTVFVPMYGQKESLNVATTFGIVVYEVARQMTSRI